MIEIIDVKKIADWRCQEYDTFASGLFVEAVAANTEDARRPIHTSTRPEPVDGCSRQPNGRAGRRRKIEGGSWRDNRR